MPKVTKVPQDYLISLELNRKEAEILVDVLGKFVAGGCTNALYRALRDAGVDSGVYEVISWNNKTTIPTLDIVKR